MRKSSTLPALDSSLDLPETEARFQYLILSQRRTGSSMLSSSLEKTGVAGVPREYFNDTSLKTLSQPVTMPDLQEYFVGIRSRRTTKNGVFGMKVHFEHFQKLFLDGNRISQAGIGFLKSFSRIIVISRRDKIAQAISRLAASRNKIWNSREESDEGLHNHEFRKEDTPEILKYLHQACEEERRWAQISDTLKLATLHLAYEDLCAEPNREMQRVFNFLGLQAEYAAPDTVKISRDSNRDAKRMFLAAIGAETNA